MCQTFTVLVLNLGWTGQGFEGEEESIYGTRQRNLPFLLFVGHVTDRVSVRVRDPQGEV